MTLERTECIVSAGAITFRCGSYTFRANGKWLGFYGLLVLARGGRIDRDQVCRLRGWSDDPLANGREIARHLKSVKLARLALCPVSSNHPTVAWALSDAYAIRFEPVDMVLKAEALFKTGAANPLAFGGQSLDTILPFGLAMTRAALAFYRGDLRDALEIARQAEGLAVAPDMRAVALVWQLRALQRMPHSDETLEAIEAGEIGLHKLPPGELVRFMRRRYDLMITLHSPTGDWPARAAALGKAVDAPQPTVDVSNLTYAANYAALTLRRLGQIEKAADRIATALLCASACGDVYLSQVVLFNAGLIASEWCEGTDELLHRRADLAVQALKLVSHISDNHSIGRDSAQNEILIAELHLRRQEWREASAAIDKARNLAERSTNMQDLAELSFCEARLLAMHGLGAQGSAGVKTLLDQAEELFMQLGREDRLAAVRGERQRLPRKERMA